MNAPLCVVIGAGRMAGGFIAPVLRSAGWELLLVGRDRAVIDAIAARGGIWLRIGTAGIGEHNDRWISGVTAATLNDPRLRQAVVRADLLATAVGPSALGAAGRALAPLLRARLDESGAPVNIITFENHRRATELLAHGLIEADSSLAGEIGRRVGIGGAAVWRAISGREITPSGARFDADETDECYVDAASLVQTAAPLDGSAPGLELVRSFADRMVEKLWVFNAGHAAAAYLGWRAGCATLAGAMSRPGIRAAVASVVEEARQAFLIYLHARPGSAPIEPRPVSWVLDRYADPSLDDPVARVGREPRRKLAAEDRLVGPAIECLAAGFRPVALACAAAAALTYADPSDLQAADLQKELELVGPEEVLATVSGLHPQEELTRLISDQYRRLRALKSSAVLGVVC